MHPDDLAEILKGDAQKAADQAKYGIYVKILENESGNCYYNIYSHNRNILATSEIYDSRPNCERAARNLVKAITKRGIYIKK